MNHPNRIPDVMLDRLVREHLDRASQSVDASQMLQQIHARQSPDSPHVPLSVRPTSRMRTARRLLMVAATAAVIVLAFLGGMHSSHRVDATPATVVEDAQRVHALPVDRCYLVQVIPHPGGRFERFPPLARIRRTLLWTRGEHYRLESMNPQRRWVWGRDDEGVWIAVNGKVGFRLAPDEERESLGLLCDVLSMRMDTLLDDVLERFTLHHLDDEETPGRHVIVATPTDGRAIGRVRRARLEIDAETKVVQRIVLGRMYAGRRLATVIFTLVDSQPQLDSSYTLEGHLQPEAPVYGPNTQPQKRGMLLRRFFGLRMHP